MHKIKNQLATFLCLSIIAFSFAQKQTYNVGVLLDNRSEKLKPLLLQLQHQIKAVVGEDAIINFPSENILVNNFNLKTAELHYQNLLNNNTDKLFQQKKLAGEHNLRIATIFTYGANEDGKEAQDYLPEDDFNIAAEPENAYVSSHTRDKLEGFIADYNTMFGTSYTTKDSKLFEGYFKDISKRLKEREKQNFNDEKDRLDIVIVVNMMLTGFDAKKVNTLYVDKNLKQHGLIQAFSRTNRILGEQKSQGNILCFRNLKKSYR